MMTEASGKGILVPGLERSHLSPLPHPNNGNVFFTGKIQFHGNTTQNFSGHVGLRYLRTRSCPIHRKALLPLSRATGTRCVSPGCMSPNEQSVITHLAGPWAEGLRGRKESKASFREESLSLWSWVVVGGGWKIIHKPICCF